MLHLQTSLGALSRVRRDARGALRRGRVAKSCACYHVGVRDVHLQAPAPRGILSRVRHLPHSEGAAAAGCRCDLGAASGTCTGAAAGAAADAAAGAGTCAAAAQAMSGVGWFVSNAPLTISPM